MLMKIKKPSVHCSVESIFSLVCLNLGSILPSATCNSPPEEMSASSALPFNNNVILIYLLSQIFCFSCSVHEQTNHRLHSRPCSKVPKSKDKKRVVSSRSFSESSFPFDKAFRSVKIFKISNTFLDKRRSINNNTLC